MATSNKNFIVKNGLDANGDISTTGQVNVNYSAGDEGGQIFLKKSVTNTTISSGVNIDVYQNRLRFFEQGGTSRGFYLDITTGGTGAGTNLVSGGSASNSFTTIATTSGTSPVADSSTDTLTLSAGTGITITGDSTTDTITIASTITDTNTTYDLTSTGTTTASINLVPSSGATDSVTITGSGATSVSHSAGAITISSTAYTLPAGTSTVLGGIKLASDTAQTVAANAVSTTASRTYGLQVNASGQGVVNIPWSDTNTTYDLTSTGTTTASINLVPSSGVTDSVTITGSGATSVSHSAGAITISSTDNNWYPTGFSWTGGTTAGPTGSLTGTGMSAVSYAAIPSAASGASGIVTTTTQTFDGNKTFSGSIVVNGASATIAGNTYIGGGYGATGATIFDTGAISADGEILTGGALTRTSLAGGGSTTATFNNTGNLIRTTSSARYKQDITDATYSYEDILSLRPKTFRLKNEVVEDDNARTYAGLIAEEVDQLESLRVFVSYLPQENGPKIPDGIQYGEMVSALVSAIKHQNTLINTLTARIEALENR